ncbi:MAG: hypothetical protein ABW022_21440, partial [Actinoplanes sp.]
MTAAPPGADPTTPHHRAAAERLVPAAGVRRHATHTRPEPPPSEPAGSLPAVLMLCVVAFLAARPPWWSFNYGAILAVIAIVLTGRPPKLRAVDTVALLTAGWAA